jgi:gliding motility-associated-like protein
MVIDFKRFFVLLFVFLCSITNKVSAQSIGGVTTGAQTYCDTLNSGFVSVSSYVGIVTTWLYSTDGGVNWTSNGNTFTTQSYFNLKQSTCFKVVIKNGAFPPDTSSVACITIYLPTFGGTILGGGSFCGSSGSGTLYLTGNIGNVLKWQFSTTGGSTWTTITNTTTTLSYSNITQNTLYWAIVQNSTFCLQDTSSQVGFTINPLTVAGSINSINTTTVCYYANSSTINLSGNVGSILNWISSTNNGTFWNSISNTTNTLITSGLTQTTLFGAIVQSANCDIDTTNYLKITVLVQNTVNAGPDVVLSQGQSITLNGLGSGTPLWLPVSGLDNPGIFNPVATPNVSTNYILTITDANLCISSDTVLVTVLPITFDGMISSVFSPNGDGINDNWYIENIKYYPENEVTVYNIYGNVVYNKKGYNNDWQGTFNGAALPDGTYFYIVTIDSSSPILKGSLDILKNK